MTTTIPQYEAAQKKATAEMATLQLHARRAIDASLEATRPEGSFYIAPDRLEDEAVRTQAKQAFKSAITSPYMAGIGAMAGDDELNMNRFMKGWFGFSFNQIDQAIDAMKGGYSFEALSDFLVKKTDYQKTLAIAQEHAMGILNDVPATDILSRVGVSGANPAEVTLEDKLQLLQAEQQFGCIPPKMLDHAAYMR